MVKIEYEEFQTMRASTPYPFCSVVVGFGDMLSTPLEAYCIAGRYMKPWQWDLVRAEQHPIIP